MSRIKTEFTSEDKQIDGALHKMQRELDKLIAQNKTLASTSKAGGADAQKAAAEQTKSLLGLQKEMIKLTEQERKRAAELKQHSSQQHSLIGQSITGLGQMAAGWFSVQSAIQLATAAFKHHQEQQQKAAEFQLGQADPERQFLINLGSVDTKVRDDALAKIQKISDETKAQKKDLFLAAAEAISAAPGGDVNIALDAVRVGARVAPQNAAQQKAISGGLLDLSNLTKSADALQNLGLFAQIGAQSRISDPSSIAQNLVPAAANVAGFGGSDVESAALVAAVTKRLVDPQGATSGTSAVSLAQQLQAFLPTSDTFKENAKGRRVVDQKGTGLETTAQRIEFMQNNALAREKFLAGASFEKKALGGITELVSDPTSEIAKNFRSITSSLPKAGAERGEAATRFLAGLQDTGTQQLADFSRGLERASESLDDLNKIGAVTAITASRLDEILSKSGQDAFNTWIEVTAFKLDTLFSSFAPEKFAAQTLRERKIVLESTPPAERDELTVGRIKVLEQLIKDLEANPAQRAAVQRAGPIPPGPAQRVSAEPAIPIEKAEFPIDQPGPQPANAAVSRATRFNAVVDEGAAKLQEFLHSPARSVDSEAGRAFGTVGGSSVGQIDLVVEDLQERLAVIAKPGGPQEDERQLAPLLTAILNKLESIRSEQATGQDLRPLSAGRMAVADRERHIRD